MTQETQDRLPVIVSPEALFALNVKARQWSGLPDAVLTLGVPENGVSPWAEFDANKHRFTVNADELILNPNRVLLSVTPFRLRQEAVLSGALMHESAHARFTKWARLDENGEFLHSDGQPVSKAAFDLALACEEARIEGLFAAQASEFGAHGLGWTMRASAAYLLPPTTLGSSAEQQILDVIESWALRAGRQISLGTFTDHSRPLWVGEFSSLLRRALSSYLEAVLSLDPGVDDIDDISGFDDRSIQQAHLVLDHLLSMVRWDGDSVDLPRHTGTFMVDRARDILEILFPETPPDEQPQMGGCCSLPMPGQGGENSDDDGESSDGDESDGDESDGDDGESSGALSSTLTDALKALEQEAQASVEAEADAQAAVSADGLLGGSGPGGTMGGNWRPPTAEERDLQRGAEHLLRSLIDPSESAKRVVTDQPSATVDGAALAAWRAGGAVREPRFFVRTHRTAERTPPVEIAILVDVSVSMSVLQRPSAFLSWALAAAALDLRNFAGRGQKISSCLIHWGDDAEVIQANGRPIPGIREVSCDDGTRAMGEALDLAARQIPEFFEHRDKPANRLLVQFTDWLLAGACKDSATPKISRALEVGVNMLTVTPPGHRYSQCDLPEILASSPIQRGVNSVVQYDPNRPAAVWDHAAQMLHPSNGTRPAPFDGF